MTRPKPDPIFFLQEQYDADTDPRKIILGVGAYRDANGKVGVNRWTNTPALRSALRQRG